MMNSIKNYRIKNERVLGSMFHTMVIWGSMLTLASCASHGPPTWVNHVSELHEELCAVGVSGPTFYPEDARTQSQAMALTELARALEVRVKTDTIMYSSGSRQSFDTTLQEVAGLTSDVVVKKAQVQEQWVHAGEDQGYGEKGTVYTLVCMPLNFQ